MKTEFVSAITQLCNEKGVPRGVVMEAIEAALVSAYRRNFDKPNQDLSAKIDESTGEVRIFWHRKVTSLEPEPVEPPAPVEATEAATAPLSELGEPAEPTYETITVEDAQKVDASLGEGDTLTVDVTPQQFGRIAAQTAKQVVMQKLREAERKMVYDEFQEREGEIVHGIVQRLEQGNVIVELGRAEAVMPRSEQVPSERYYPGQRLRVYVSEVNETYRGPQIIVSRGHRLMLRRLLEQEVPEIYSGTVEIKAIAREGGARSKVAVVAHQAGIDPVGSCVGMRGVRIQNIVNELNGEKIDVVEWDEDVKRYIANALSPAQVSSVDINDDEKTATVVVPERQLSLAIGKEGQNARLAAKLTGWRIDIKSDVQVAEELSGAPAATEPVDGSETASAVTESVAASGTPASSETPTS
ncbi:MAG TPA: transcription termination factor NusA [Chloroflexota bacterium]|nr:transcription termination factor NusA [Chloroflexota bacterium]